MRVLCLAAALACISHGAWAQCSVPNGQGSYNYDTCKNQVVAVAPGTTITATPPAPPATLVDVAPITIATTGTAVNFAFAALVNGIAVCGQHATGSGNSTTIVNNTSTVWVGGSGVTIGGTGALAPGQCASVAVSNANGIFVNGIAGDGLNPVSAN